MSIYVDSLVKQFKQPKRESGLKGVFKHIVKPEFTTKSAVDNVSFDIADGESVAYIGPNGAGKSTTIKMLTGILFPTSGSVEVQGVNPHKNREANARNVGVVFGQRTQLWWDIPVEESLRLLKDIYEIPEARYRENMELFKDVFGLSEFLTRPARRISLGQRMRADLAASLIHDPKVLYLDEPTIGLDISVKESMRKFIRMINRERGTTIILTSHDLTDIEDLCERVIVIDEGKVVCDEKLASLTELYAHERGVRITLKRPDGAIAGKLAEYPALRSDYDGGHALNIMFDISDYSAYEVISLVGAACDIQDIQLIEPDIKAVIAKIYKSELMVPSA